LLDSRFALAGDGSAAGPQAGLIVRHNQLADHVLQPKLVLPTAMELIEGVERAGNITGSASSGASRSGSEPQRRAYTLPAALQCNARPDLI
jgi:hypothetical protein